MCGGCIERSVNAGGRKVDNEVTEAVYEEFRKKNKPKKHVVLFNKLRTIFERKRSTRPSIEHMIGTGNFPDNTVVYVAAQKPQVIAKLRTLPRRISSVGRRF
jgi:hypothetical protein